MLDVFHVGSRFRCVYNRRCVRCFRFMAEDKRKLILVSIHNLPLARCILMNFKSCCDSLCISCCHSSGLSNLWFVHVLWLVFEIISCCSMFLDLLDVEHLALASTLSVFGKSFSDLLSLLCLSLIHI